MDPPSGGVFRIGHRGCCGQHPENTVSAVEAAAPHVDAVEVDVRACATGELVVFHDETLDRVTAETGWVDETPLATIRDLDVLGSGEPIPTVPELLDAMSALPEPPALDVEIKPSGIASAVVAACTDTGVAVFYSSFHESVLREIRAADPNAPLAVVCSERPHEALELADAVDAVALHPWKALILDGDADLVAAAHDRGLAVNAWSADATSEVRRLRTAGVDGVIADHWDVFGPVAGSGESDHTDALDP